MKPRNKNKAPRRKHRYIELAIAVLYALLYPILRLIGIERDLSIALMACVFSLVLLSFLSLFSIDLSEATYQVFEDSFILVKRSIWKRRLGYDCIQGITISYGGEFLAKGGFRVFKEKGVPLTLVSTYDSLHYIEFLKRRDYMVYGRDELFASFLFFPDLAILLPKTTAPIFVAEQIWNQNEELRHLLEPYQFRVFIAPYGIENQEEQDFVPLSCWE